MARPPRFDSDQLLDAAVRLACGSGPAAVTMSAVAEAAGAPSGSVYYRFPGRSALLAELWLRTVDRFQRGYLAAFGRVLGEDLDPVLLATIADARQTAREAARQVVEWSRSHPDEAALLLYGPDDFGRADWSQEHRLRADRGNQRVHSALAALAALLSAGEPAKDPQAVERVVLALIELPLSLVRRHLRAGAQLPEHAERLAEECADDLLARLTPRRP
ncbi:TetR/AcrR family transcriptional regulator [Kitasatospora acidiphila]|uniref:TetR/AcrR family transcriptional regulator n=1 Tax=Kitasatospora acidiphila TaxID=2567942 RepID=A0A540W176_9ACTN|nr:TetR/AcrR family transcriptional regulator [Kitasatospora acidiphila]TQF02775.1 TetR/AcrR family transcriptional regulator [Kitasatospora acidiphila]